MFNVEEFIDDMDVKAFLLFQVALVVVINLEDFSIMIEMVSNVNQSVDPTIGIWDVITTLCTTFALF
jgi:hypothetical protein